MSFSDSLQLGEEFETRYALPWLLKNYPEHWISETHDYRVGSFAGPRLKRAGDRDITLPDFMLKHPQNGHGIMFEAKYRHKPFSIPGFPGRIFLATEEYKVLQYQEAARIFCMDLKFILGCGQTGSIHIADNWIPHYFNNHWGKGAVCAFDITDNAVASLGDFA